MGESLSNLGTSKVNATEQQNVAGVMTPILSFQPDDNLELVVRNQGEVGGEPGVALYLDLRDSNGDPLPVDTSLTLRWDEPSLDSPDVVAETKSNIGTYNRLSIKEQQNSEYRDRVRIPLKGSALVVEDAENLEIAVESSEVIDWSNSVAYIEENHTTVRQEG